MCTGEIEPNEKSLEVLGAQWGDEGKGKLVDILAQTSGLCCRCNGGANAGHTLVVEGKKSDFMPYPLSAWLMFKKMFFVQV